MEKTVGTHAVYTVRKRLVTDLTEVASLVVLMDFTANIAIEVMSDEKCDERCIYLELWLRPETLTFAGYHEQIRFG